MEDNQDLTILEEDVLEDMAVPEEEEILETIEVEDVDVTIEIVAETATADAVDGNTVKLKDSNYVIILR
jgi:hypothetical protein